LHDEFFCYFFDLLNLFRRVLNLQGNWEDIRVPIYPTPVSSAIDILHLSWLMNWYEQIVVKSVLYADFFLFTPNVLSFLSPFRTSSKSPHGI
jgi:hypothetical protein